MAIENPYETPLGADGTRQSPAGRPLVRIFLALSALGLATGFCGFLYGALLVGIPFQDPTPEMAQREAFHVAVSKWIISIGGILMLTGLTASILVSIGRALWRTAK